MKFEQLTEEELLLMHSFSAPFSMMASCVMMKLFEKKFGYHGLSEEVRTGWRESIRLSYTKHIEGMSSFASETAREGIDYSIQRALEAADESVGDMMERAESFIADCDREGYHGGNSTQEEA